MTWLKVTAILVARIRFCFGFSRVLLQSRIDGQSRGVEFIGSEQEQYTYYRECFLTAVDHELSLMTEITYVLNESVCDWHVHDSRNCFLSVRCLPWSSSNSQGSSIPEESQAIGRYLL